MTRLKLAQLTLSLLIAATFMQAGASLFAIVVSVSTLVAAPPESLTIVQGAYGFNPDVFWNTFPNVHLAFVLLALIFCWKTHYRKWVFAGWAVGIMAGVVAIFLLSPVQSEFLTAQYSNSFDPALKEKGDLWLTYSVLFMSLSSLSGLVYILGFIKAQPESQ